LGSEHRCLAQQACPPQWRAEQESATLIVYRRTDQGFVREVLDGRDSILTLPHVDVELTLGEIYDGIEFGPEGE
jgi:hypothetical protein